MLVNDIKRIMSRPLRIEYPDIGFHVVNRRRCRESVFRNDEDYLTFIGLLKETVDMWNLRVNGVACDSPYDHHSSKPPGRSPFCRARLLQVLTVFDQAVYRELVQRNNSVICG